MASGWRTVQVFISSTFRDMHAERDYLVKVVFPALRERLEKYRIHLVDIDLRWGVTQNQADNDEALDLCLKQIDECRPFFVGILGERYGWVPKALSQEATSRYGWIQGETGKSITELEILYGVLQKPEMYGHSLFFFRDPSFIQDVPEPKQSDVRAEDADSEEKLARLKQAVLGADLPIPPMESYPCRYAGLRVNPRILRMELEEAEHQALSKAVDGALLRSEQYDALDGRLQEIAREHGTVYLEGLDTFGQAVGDRLWEAIREELNLSETPPTETGEQDELAEELDYHERFMESRLQVYVGRDEIQRELAAFADGDDETPCLVTGPSGSGKSAAMAKFVRAYAAAQPDAMVIPHFVGASPGSTNLRLMLRRFCLILQRQFEFTDTVEREGQEPEVVPAEVPQTVNELAPRLREFIERVPDDRHVVFVIDALNQLDEADNAHTMYWLPWQFPAHVKVVTSCIADPGRPEQVLQAFENRPHASVEIGALTGDERLEIVREVPSLSAKTLDPKQVGLLLENPATENPLFLLVALEELRGFGSFEHLAARIHAFPREGDTVTAIFTQVIERLEDDFGADLTRTILTLLASARRGLSERELEELVASADESGELFPVLRQLRPYLLQRAALLDFYHRNLYRAVREKYLPTDEDRCAAHAQLSEYFGAQEYWMESLEEQRARVKRLPPTPRPANVRMSCSAEGRHGKTVQ